MEEALSALVASTPQAQLPSTVAFDISGLARWTPQARRANVSQAFFERFRV